MAYKDTFKTIESDSQGIFKDKGSSFISYIYPVFDEAEVKKKLLLLKKEHPKARHICYAYRWGPDPEYNRINDDGEPGGSAGKPILNQLKSYDLENTLIAVVRYFGGSLLGVPGLIHAYKSAASDAIHHASIITKRRNTYYKMNISYVLEKQLISLIKKFEGIIINKNFGEAIEIHVAFPLSGDDIIQAEFSRAGSEMQWGESASCNYLKKDHF
jgi:uncharacterized YigZ family protein